MAVLQFLMFLILVQAGERFKDGAGVAYKRNSASDRFLEDLQIPGMNGRVCSFCVFSDMNSQRFARTFGVLFFKEKTSGHEILRIIA